MYGKKFEIQLGGKNFKFCFENATEAEVEDYQESQNENQNAFQ